MRWPGLPFGVLASLGLEIPAQPPLQPAAVASPTAAAAALRALAERLLVANGGDLARAVQELWLTARAEAERPAAAELLLREAQALAERHDDARLAWRALDQLAATIRIDLTAERSALLRRLATNGERRTSLVLAQLVLTASREQLRTEAAPRSPDLLPLAMHVVARDDGALATFVRAACDDVQAWRQVRACTPSAFWSQQAPDVFCRLATGGDCRALGVDWLASFGVDLTAAERTRTVADLPAARLAALATPSLPAPLRAALLRQAQAAAAREFRAASDEQLRRTLAHTIAARTRDLAQCSGVTSLQFAADGDTAQLRIANGDWRVRDGRLLGGCRGTANFATHPLAFTAVRSVVIRGGIQSADGQNFRCQVGDANLLLNWEVRDENHLWHHGRCEAKGPPALRTGIEHTILLFADEGRVHVCIDDQPWWSIEGSLDGTITVYPALGSEIFVREILIDGQPDDFVTGPRGDPK